METNDAKMARTDQWKVPDPGIDDRLSSLPDEVISHILSLLPTKYAVGTAVLSRRWKDLWTRVSDLDLDNRLVYRDLTSSDDVVDDLLLEEMEKRRWSEFSRFQDRVLSQHRNLDSLRRFRLYVLISQPYWKEMEDYLDNKKGLVFGSQVEEIDITLMGGYGTHFIWLPESFYTLKNLKVVKLDGVGVVMAANGSVSLPSLKILQLQKVKIKDYESLARLISGCPVLETLHLKDCFVEIEGLRDDEEYKLIASLPFLSNLNIFDWNRQCLCPIAIEAPNLEHLVLTGFLPLQFLGSSSILPCLHSAVVASHVDSEDRERECLVRLLTKISNAKDMCLTESTLELLSDIKDIQLPVFPNVTHLTIELCRCPFWFLHSLLQSVPKLQSLVVKPLMIDSEPMMSEETEPTFTWQCLLSSLEKIKIKGFVPFENDVKMVGYLLSAGSVLEKVDIHLRYNNIIKCKRKKLASLLMLPRESSACDVRFSLRGSEIDSHEINMDSKDDDIDEYELDEDED